MTHDEKHPTPGEAHDEKRARPCYFCGEPLMDDEAGAHDFCLETPGIGVDPY